MDKIKEGSLYKTIEIENETFLIYYGYYSDSERGRWEPAPIFPDFLKSPTFTKSGCPFARADQDICEYYIPKPTVSGEEWCNDCIHFKLYEELIGVCQSDKRKSIIRQNE